MNSLEIYSAANRCNPRLLMNDLQNRGMVSDNAVHLADVAKEDSDKAVTWLKSWNKSTVQKI